MKVVFIFNNIGPYHLARLAALKACCDQTIIGIQLARREKQRDWRVEQSDVAIETVSESTFEDIPARRLAREVQIKLDQVRPNVVFVCGYAHAAMRRAILWGNKNKVPVILMSDSHRDDRRRWWIKEQLKRTFLRDKLRGAFVSGSLAAQYMESLGIPPNRIWKGYDAVDNHFFAEHARRVRNDSDRIRLNLELPERYFLYVGRLAPEKNIETLLLSYDSYRKIAKKHIANLVIVGSGASESHLKTLCQQNRIRGVDWRQFQQQSQLVELYALSSGLILPSRSEPWGLVVNEALASGIPVVVSSNCGCAPELVLPGLNGWVFDVGNSSTLTENLLRLHALGPHELNDIRQISAALVSLFSLENWCRAVKDIICQIGPKEPSY